MFLDVLDIYSRRCQELDVCESEKSTKPGTAQQRGWLKMTAEKGGPGMGEGVKLYPW
jgi:hypothetical protein